MQNWKNNNQEKITKIKEKHLMLNFKAPEFVTQIDAKLEKANSLEKLPKLKKKKLI